MRSTSDFNLTLNGTGIEKNNKNNVESSNCSQPV
jgi:hypothetical protein